VAIAQVLVSPPANLISDATTYSTNLQTFFSDYQTFLDTHSDLFTPRTTDDNADDGTLVPLYNNWGQFQEGKDPLFEQYQLSVKAFLTDDQNTNSLLRRLVESVKGAGYTVTAPAISFTGQDQTDQSGVVVCTITGTITGTSDLSEGVKNLAAYAKQTLIALFSSSKAEYEYTVDSTSGVFTITLSCSRNKAEVITNTVRHRAVAVKNVISDFQTKAQAKLDDYKTQATGDVATVEATASTARSDADVSAQAVADAVVSLKDIFNARDTGKEAYKAAVATAAAALETTDDEYQFFLDSYIRYRSECYEDFKAFVADYKSRLDQVACEVSTKVADYLEASAAALRGSANDAANEYWSGAHTTLEADIKESCTLQEQLQALHDAAQAKVTEMETTKTEWETELQGYVTDLKNEQEQSVTQIQDRIHDDPEKYKDMLEAMLQGTFDKITPGSVVIDFQNTDKSQGNWFKCTLSFIDNQVGKTAQEIKDEHILAIKGAVGTCGCNKGFAVAEVSTSKRQSGPNQYEATLGDVPANPSGEPASANTLVFSLVWAIVASFMLVWF
jgi:gas vesicle protein